MFLCFFNKSKTNELELIPSFLLNSFLIWTLFLSLTFFIFYIFILSSFFFFPWRCFKLLLIAIKLCCTFQLLLLFHLHWFLVVVDLFIWMINFEEFNNINFDTITEFLFWYEISLDGSNSKLGFLYDIPNTKPTYVIIAIIINNIISIWSFVFL